MPEPSFKSGRLGYVTSRKVFIASPQLALISAASYLFVILYIGVYHIGYRNSYMKYEALHTGHKVGLRHPTVDNCEQSSADCKEDFQPLTELAYCDVNGTATTESSTVEQKPCLYLDSLSNIARVGDDNVLLTTMVTSFAETFQTDTCNPAASNGYTCNKMFVPKGDILEYYVADVENFWLLVEHTVFAKQLDIASNGFESAGLLQETKGGQFESIPECSKNCSHLTAFSDEWGDHIKLSRLLDVMGLDLDRDVSALGTVRRQSGIVVQLEVVYSNTVPWNLFVGNGQIRYQYKARAVKTPHYQIIELKDREGVKLPSAKRVQMRKSGIYFKIIVDGKLGRFDPLTVALAFVAGSAFIKIIAYVCDWIATHPSLLLQKAHAEKNDRAKTEIVLPEEPSTPLTQSYLVVAERSGVGA